MAYALVGTAGALATGSGANIAITPSWGASENRTAGNLLLCGVVGYGTTTTPSTPAGWSLAKTLGAGGSATIFYRIATGLDAAPTIAALASTTWIGAIAEFSGNATSSPLDQSGSKNGSSGTQTAVNAAADALAGELFFYAVRFVTSSSAARTITNTLNNGMSNNDVNNNATSTTRHASIGWAITTGNSAADQDAASLSSTYTNMTMVVASFLLFTTPDTFPPKLRQTAYLTI